MALGLCCLPLGLVTIRKWWGKNLVRCSDDGQLTCLRPSASLLPACLRAQAGLRAFGLFLSAHCLYTQAAFGMGRYPTKLVGC